MGARPRARCQIVMVSEREWEYLARALIIVYSRNNLMVCNLVFRIYLHEV